MHGYAVYAGLCMAMSGCAAWLCRNNLALAHCCLSLDLILGMCCAVGFNADDEVKGRSASTFDWEIPRQLLLLARELWAEAGQPTKPVDGGRPSPEWAEFQQAVISEGRHRLLLGGSEARNARGDFGWLWELSCRSRQLFDAWAALLDTQCAE